jgi:hypothetical protein
MKHLKTFENLSSLNENNYDKIKFDQISTIIDKLNNLNNLNFYEKSNLKEVYSISNLEFENGEKVSNKISDILNIEKIKYSKVFNTFDFELGRKGSISSLRISISQMEDEYFLVVINYDVQVNPGYMTKSIVFKCDQESGLYALFFDFKKILDDTMNYTSAKD